MMERVNGMPVRCVITKRVIDSRCAEGVYEPGMILELAPYDFELFVNQYPGCIQEIEMSEEDWINSGTSRALACRKIKSNFY